MQILIVEDEVAAARQLEKLVRKLRPGAVIAGVVESIRGAVQWLQTHASPELILMDIQLSDGTSWDIFGQIDVKAPVIFTTAYNEYAIKAFKVNSVDYLLKPIDEEELAGALLKFDTLHPASGDAGLRPSGLTGLPDNLQKLLESVKADYRYRQRLMVRTHDGLKSLETRQIAYIKALDKLLYIYTFAGQVHTQDDSLEELESTLDPAVFFRINRKYIAHIDALEKILTLSSGKIRVELKHCKDDDIFLSQSRAVAFKAWLDK
jgi:DNA-binding LytR/AlgR family response regulator